MIVRDIHHILEAWAPKALAWDRDNVGLQAGSWSKPVHKILVGLDLTDGVLQEARKKSMDMIITHHPPLFRALHSLTDEDRTGRLLRGIVSADIAVYSMHTNLDFTRAGVSDALASCLGINGRRVLEKQRAVLKKAVVFVPLANAETVAGAMAEAGGGHIGNYSSCSFRTEGTGTFLPLNGALPAIGHVGRLERVEEARIEMIVPSWKIGTVLAAMHAAHPYEEVAYDVYDLANTSDEYGAGIIGELEEPVTLREFLHTVRTALSAGALRYTGALEKKVRRVAVCGGSGAELLGAAVQQKADAFVTADVKYHTFQEAEGMLALIDAGHFETESPVTHTIVQYLRSHPSIRSGKVRVGRSQQMSNPVQYYMQ